MPLCPKSQSMRPEMMLPSLWAEGAGFSCMPWACGGMHTCQGRQGHWGCLKHPCSVLFPCLAAGFAGLHMADAGALCKEPCVGGSQ